MLKTSDVHWLSVPLLLLTLLLSGCGTTSAGSPPAEDMDDVDYFSPSTYQIGIDDLVEIAVWRNPDLSVVLPVRPDGMISVPLVGDVKAGGETPYNVGKDIEQAMKEFIREPKVTVLVRELRSNEYLYRVRVTGAVTTPLSAPHRAGMTVLDLVLDAGGITEFAAPGRARLYRRIEGETQVFAVRLQGILEDGDLSTNYSLRPGDIVSIPERMF
ncbi:MAG: XrtA/PEP-CTERM system exopolysaccharide export protein [Aquisalimonadaceae bacterium]